MKCDFKHKLMVHSVVTGAKQIIGLVVFELTEQLPQTVVCNTDKKRITRVSRATRQLIH